MPERVPVALKVNGEAHEGFTQGSVNLSLDQIPATFSVSYDDLASPSDDPRAIYAGDRVTVEVDGEDLIVGFAEESSVDYDDGRITFQVSGSSVTCDLVECSAVHKPSAWRDIALDRLAAKLLEPFELDFILTGDPGDAFPRFKIDPGETPADALARAARLRGRVLYTVNDALVIERAGEADTSTVLRRGENILAGSHTSSWSNRFSSYIFRGQTRATDDLNGASAHHIRGEAVDPQITRYRPFLVTHSTGQGGTRDLGKRAILERNQRMGRGERVSYTVDGWKTDEGWLWRPNVRVFVEDDWLGIQGELLVVGVSYQFGIDEPPQTRLELTRPEAYDEVDFPARGRGRLWI